MKKKGEKFVCLTAYDACFAKVLENAGVEVILVGDSLGMVVQGKRSTLPVTIADMIYHTQCVSNGKNHAMLMVDIPFMSDMTPQQSLATAARLIKKGGAEIVKIEGGTAVVENVRLMSQRGIAVCAHLGLLPQSVNKMGGYRVQGKDDLTSQRIVDDAQLLVEAGADLVLLECVPKDVARRVVDVVEAPVIGIGAGNVCDGQVLVLHDMLGITPGKRPRFSRNFLEGNASILDAVSAYVAAVKDGSFPSDEQSYL